MKQASSRSLLELLLMLVIAAGLLICACGQQPAEDIEEKIRTAGDFDEWIEAVASRPHGYTPPEVTYTSALIRQAYTAGKITEEDYYRLHITAAFDYENLPPEYRDKAERDPAPDYNWLLRELSQKIDTFSPETQAALRPYVLSFDDPQSYWYDPAQPTASEGSDFPQGSCDCAADMERPLVGGDYFLVTGPAGTEEKQAIVENALQYSYRSFVALGFNEPTDWIRVRLQDSLSSPDYLGEQWMAELIGRRRCHIAILADTEQEQMEAITAHELFHCFQEYIPDNASASGPWEWESTATWAEEWVYPLHNTEHGRDWRRFSTFHEYFFKEDEVSEYASYLYWFYIYQKDGKTGQAVKTLLEEIYRTDRRAALEARPGFYTEFKEYALWNLNTPPYQYYEDAEDEPVTRPFGACVVHEELPADMRYYESVELAPGGIMYYVYTFDWNVMKIRFDLTQLQKTAENQSGIQVAYRAAGRSCYEDVSYRDELIFCRNRLSEDIDSIVFIISNAALDNADNSSTLRGELLADTRDFCVPEWHGYVDYSYSASGPGDGHGSGAGSYNSFGTTRLEETLLLDEERNRFYATRQAVSHSSSYRWYVAYDPPEYDVSYVAWESKEENPSGSRTDTFEVDDDCPPDDCDNLPAVIKPSGDNASLYYHRDLYFQNIGTYTVTHKVMNMPGELGRMQGHAPELWVDEYTTSLSVYCPPDALLLHMADNGSRLYGSYTEGNRSVTAEFVFE